MRRGSRIALVVVGIGLVVVAAGIAWLLFSLDRIVAREIESQGEQLTGVPVHVKGVHIDLTGGSGTIRGIRIGNPEGFSPADAIALDSIHVQIDLHSLTGGPVRIPRVEIGQARVRIEVAPDGRSNLDTLRRTIQSRSSSPPASQGGKTEPIRLRVGKLRFAGGQVEALPEGHEDQSRSASLPAIALTDLGGTGGAPPGEIGRQVLLAFTRRVASVEASSQLQAVIRKQVGGGLGEAAGKAAGGLLEKALR